VLSEVEQVCDWFVVIEGGRVIFQGPASALPGAQDRLTAAPERAEDLPRLAGLLAARGHSALVVDGHVAVELNGADAPIVAADVNRAAIDEGIVLVELHHARAGLESRYLHLVGKA
jgi:ABC-2 type transport system ATP-binding protein